ncbi:hypothetical protein K8I28_07335 [bacterium]|nr:hypothetical protein [bacterium]
MKSIAIPVFENQTAEFGIVETLTDEVVGQFTRDNSLKIRDLDAADSVLRGTLMRVEDQPFTVRADESVEEYKVTLHVRLVFENLKDGKIILDESISGFGVYPFGGGSRAQRDEGIEEAIGKLSQDILNKTVSGW